MPKRQYELSKRCRCRNRDRCNHPWWLRVFAAGKRHRVNLTQRYNLAMPLPLQDVYPHAAQAKLDVQKGLLRPSASDTRLTFGDVADRYAVAHPRRNYYLEGMRSILVPGPNGTSLPLESKPVDDVTGADIKHVVRVWRARPRTRAGAKSGAVAERHILQSGRHLFNWAIEEGLATRSPFYSAQGIPIIHIRGTKARKRRLEEGEEQRIRDAACDYVRDFFTAMLETGCRPGELRTLQWSEVRGDEIVLLADKTKDREERRIPVMPTLRAILERRQLGPDGTKLPSSAFVFGNDTGEEVKKRRLCALWLATCKRAGVKDLHLHDLRREAGSQLLEAGAGIHEVRDALGHSTTTMTSTYLSVNTLAKAYQRRHAQQARRKMKVIGPRGQSSAKRKSS